MEGRGGLKTSLKIDLTKTTGQPGSCGVKYNEVMPMCDGGSNCQRTHVYVSYFALFMSASPELAVDNSDQAEWNNIRKVDTTKCSAALGGI